MAEPLLLCQQPQAVGLASSKSGSKILVTVQGDGVISYDLARLVSCHQQQPTQWSCQAAARSTK